MEREKTGVELLLAEPEIVAWLGLEEQRTGEALPLRRAESLRARAADREARRRPVVPAVRPLSFGIAV
jgi:hypothetical protein